MGETKKVLHTADWHHGNYLRGHARIDEQIDRLDEMVAIAQREDVDVFLCAGDLWNEKMSYRAASQTMRRTLDALLPIIADGREIIFVAGNHDPPYAVSVMESWMRVAATHVARRLGHSQPPIRVIRHAQIVQAAGLQFVCLPWPSKAIAEKVGFDIDEAEDPRMARNRAVTAAVRQALHALVDSPDFQPNVPPVLVAHMTTSNARVPGVDDQDPEGFLWDWATEFSLSASDVPNRFACGMFGHIHHPQDLHTTKVAAFPFPSRYAGSPVRLNMKEREDEKSVTIWTIDSSHQAEYEIIPLTQTPMAVVEAVVADLDRLEAESALLRDAFVRVTLHHDGTVPEIVLQSRLKKMYPKHVGLRLMGPKLAIATRTEREKIIIGESTEVVGGSLWNPADVVGTSRAFAEERFRDDPDREGLLSLVETLATEVSRKWHGEETDAEILEDPDGDGESDVASRTEED